MKSRVALLASLFSLCLVAVVAAQVSTTTGTVVSNSGGSLVITTDSGERTFMVDAQSSVPANLTPGTRVTVEYHTLANDKLHAFKVAPMGTDTGTTIPDTPAATTPATVQEPTPTTPTTPTTTTPTTTTTTTTTGTDTSMGTTGNTTDQTATTGRQLPATASPLPLLALAGSLALAGGALLRRRRA